VHDLETLFKNVICSSKSFQIPPQCIL